MGREHTLPLARPAAEFLVEELADEVLVYDQVSHHAHCLTAPAAHVWRMCDGVTARNTAEQVLAGYPSAPKLDAVLDQLVAVGLVRGPRPRAERVNRSRRAMLGKTAVAAAVIIASPIVYSIIAPSVAEAASGVGCGKKTQPCCTTAPTCQLGLRCLGKVCQ